MHDKNYNGSIDLDECIAMLYQRFGKEIVDERVREFYILVKPLLKRYHEYCTNKSNNTKYL